VLSGLTAKGHFPSRNARLSLDHSVMVPMHFLDPGEPMALLPIYLNGLPPPPPAATACLALGDDVRAIIEAWDSPNKLALVASGSFSLEVGGPRIADNAIAGVPDPRHVTGIGGHRVAVGARGAASRATWLTAGDAGTPYGGAAACALAGPSGTTPRDR
jgi:hypothetical protein